MKNIFKKQKLEKLSYEEYAVLKAKLHSLNFEKDLIQDKIFAVKLELERGF